MKNRKRLLIPAILIVILLVVRIVSLRSTFLYAGTIEATKVDLSSRVTSVIGTFDVEEGDKVVASQVLVRLSCEDIKLAADIASADYDRAEKLFKAGSMPRETFEHLRNKRDDTKVKWDWCTIKAPLNSTILNKYHEAGEYVNPGTKLLTLADLSEVWAIIYVAQPMLSKLSLGMELEGILPEVKDRAFKGKITRIGDEAEFTPKNVQTREERTRLVYGIKVTFVNSDGFLKPGMSIEVRLPK